MRFSDIPGHAEAKRRLRSLVDSGRIPHALLLQGPSGVGKFAMARATAQYIHCERRTPEGDSCGRCPSCLQHQTFNHIDTIFSFPVVKKDKIATSDDYLEEFKALMTENPFMDFEQWQIKLENINAQPMIYVDEADELIRRLSYTAHGSKYKIVLMWLPERLHENAANKLLKLIEEPFEDTIFILTSDQPRLVLPTIYSRTQRIDLMRYDEAEISQYLQVSDMENAGWKPAPLDAHTAARTAHLAGGSMTRAFNLIGVTKDSGLYLDLFMELMRKAYTRRVGDLKTWAHNVADLGREREIRFLEYCARMLRENFILNLGVPQLNYLTDNEMAFCQKFSPFINERNVMQLFDIINDARADIAANANARLVNFDVAVKVILLLKR